jgi:hypothetical protein
VKKKCPACGSITKGVYSSVGHFNVVLECTNEKCGWTEEKDGWPEGKLERIGPLENKLSLPGEFDT